MPPFSQRQGYSQPKEIVLRDDLPVSLRIPIFDILRRRTSSSFLWERIERLLNPYGTDVLPQPVSAIPISKEEDRPETIAAKRVFLSCPWFRVYDIVEDIAGQLAFHDEELRTDPEEEAQSFYFQTEINDFFLHVGIGWQLMNGEIVTRGEESFEAAVKTAQVELDEAGRPTAARRIHAALQALSLRPEADAGGAISHAIAALECVAGDITGNDKATFGDILKLHPEIFPGGLKKGLEGIWGYSCNEGARHGKEGKEPEREEAELVVGLAATVAAYLNRKRPRS